MKPKSYRCCQTDGSGMTDMTGLPLQYLEGQEGYTRFFFEDDTMVFRNLKSLTTSMGQIDLPFSGSGGDTSLFGYSLARQLAYLRNELGPGDLLSRDRCQGWLLFVHRQDGEASYVDGVGTNGGTAHIPPLQGFFVKQGQRVHISPYRTTPANTMQHRDLNQHSLYPWSG